MLMCCMCCANNLAFRYNALAGLADPTNSFFIVPVAHFPWSEKGRQDRAEEEKDL